MLQEKETLRSVCVRGRQM